MIRLLAYTGLRFGELAALRVRRIDFLGSRLTVAESATEVGGQLLFGTPKTHQQRTVPLPAVLVESLARRCEGKLPDDLLVTTALGRRSGSATGGALAGTPPSAPPASATSARTTPDARPPLWR